MKLPMRLRLIPLVLAIIFLTVFSIAITEFSESEKKVLLNSDFPQLSIRPLNDNTPTLHHAMQEHPVILVNMFASWCVPCIAELPLFSTLTSEHNIPVYGILWRDDVVEAQKWLEKYNNPFTYIWSDDKGNSAVELGVHGIPESFLVDKNGTVIWHIAGPITEDILANDLLPVIAKADR